MNSLIESQAQNEKEKFKYGEIKKKKKGREKMFIIINCKRINKNKVQKILRSNRQGTQLDNFAIRFILWIIYL